MWLTTSRKQGPVLVVETYKLGSFMRKRDNCMAEK